MCYLKSSWKMFAYGGLLKLFGDVAALVGPLSISQIVEYIQNTNNNNSSSITFEHNNHETYLNLTTNNNGTTLKMNLTHLNEKATKIYYPEWSEFIENGWIMGMLVLIASLAQGSFSQASTHIVNMVGIRLRTSIQGLIYRKTLLISSGCFFGCNKNEDDGENQQLTETKQQYTFDSGTITNLMSEDALNVMSFFWISHYVWAIPLKVCIPFLYTCTLFMHWQYIFCTTTLNT